MIPFFDYRRQHDERKREIESALARVVASGRLILGPEVEAFENEFAAWLGAGFAVGVASGTDALALALRALEIGPGDEVLTVSNAGVPPVAAIRAVGAVPRFVDVDPVTLQIAPREAEAAIGPRTRCLLPVHLYGQAAPLGELLAVAERHGLPVVEDCAQAHGTRLLERHAGTWGTIGCFSFYPTKNLGAYGDGGACVTADADVDRRLRRLRMYGFDAGDRRARVEGLNSRLDELQAAVLRAKLPGLAGSVADRRLRADRYRGALSGRDLELPHDAVGGRHSYHLFVVRSERRDELARHLSRHGIGHGLHYPEPVHGMEAYAALHDGRPLPVTERACARVLSLPMFHGLTEQEVDRVAAAVAEFS